MLRDIERRHIMKYIAALREKKPLVICLTNDVVKNFTANGLLAVGASPAMSSCIEDLRDLLPHAQALLVNIGTVNPELAAFYKKAVALANELNVPVVLDPVACSAGPFRRNIALDLLLEHKITLLRGNAGEIAALVQAKQELDVANGRNFEITQAKDITVVRSKGVDSAGVAKPGMLAAQCAKAFNVLTVVTGPIDGISNGVKTIEITNGSSMMPLVVGTGCLLGGFLAAFIGSTSTSMEFNLSSDNATDEDLFSCTLWGLTAYSVAAEMAAETCKSVYQQVEPGRFQIEFLNALYGITDDVVTKRKNWQMAFNRSQLAVYFICGTQDFKRTQNPEEAALICIETALQAGITMFQLREKGEGSLQGEAKLEFAKKVQALCQNYQVPFIMNDDMALAEQLNVDGVHIGQEDESIESVRQRFPNKIIGLSIHSPAEYGHSRVDLADYIGVGPVYGTQSKGDAKAPIGPEGIQAVRNVDSEIPIVAIGGITAETTAGIRNHGADGVSVISAITKASNVVDVVKQFREARKKR